MALRSWSAIAFACFAALFLDVSQANENTTQPLVGVVLPESSIQVDDTVSAAAAEGSTKVDHINTPRDATLGTAVLEGGTQRNEASEVNTLSDAGSIGSVLPENSAEALQLMRSEKRSQDASVPAPKSANLMRRERMPPVLVEVTDTGEVEELIEVPAGHEEEYYAAAEDAVDEKIQWGAPALSEREVARKEEEDAKILSAGSVVEIRDPALKSTPGPLIEVPTEKVFGVRSVRGWDMWGHAAKNAAPEIQTTLGRLRR